MGRSSRGNRARRLGIVGLLAVVVPLLSSCRTVAVTFVVDSTDDAVDAAPGDGVCATAAPVRCTLRAAVMEANLEPADTLTTIELQPLDYRVVFLPGPGEDLGATGDLDTWNDMVIHGHGATISQNTADRVLDHHQGRLLMDDLDIRGGSADVGGGIRNAGDLVLTLVELRNNIGEAEGGTALHQVGGSAYLDAVTVDGNRSEASTTTASAAVWVAGGGLVVRDSTVSWNFGAECVGLPVPGESCGEETWTPQNDDIFAAPSFPAGIENAGGTVVVLQSTISHHSGYFLTFGVFGGRPVGVVFRVDSPGIRADGGATYVSRSTILGNTPGIAGAAAGSVQVGGSVVDTCSAKVTSAGYNIDTAGTCFTGGVTNDVNGGMWIDGHLVDRGGPTFTHLPFFVPVINAIPSGTPGLCDASTPTDQRGRPRPAGPGCDRGAVERQPDDVIS